MVGGVRAVELRIEDRGSGLSPKIRDSMFEPFVSTKETVGVGMGLTVARHALRNLGGEIQVVDRPGGGSSAILVHPLEKRVRPTTTEPPFTP
jgi:signal transduction histidine kinase